MIEKLTEIGRLFRLTGKIIDYKPITIGNINETIRVYYNDKKSYIFQRVNINVFKDPIGVMHNIDNVTTHIREEYPDSISLHYHHTVYGDNFIIYCGEFWRIMRDFNSVTLDECSLLSEIEDIGRAFGDFQRKLGNFDASCLVETIKDFHNTELRIDTLLAYAKKHKIHMPEIEYIKCVAKTASKISVLYNDGKLPKRPCHNDTKGNNVLLDKITHRPLVVVDLDTIMPGTGLYDFADGARFICAACKEDEKDLTKVDFNLFKFKAFAEGFLPEILDAWEPIEIENIALSVFSITIELASRFLYDYLNGNVYFKIDYPEHNLVRAKCQIMLAMSIDKKMDQIQSIIDTIVQNHKYHLI